MLGIMQGEDDPKKAAEAVEGRYDDNPFPLSKDAVAELMALAKRQRAEAKRKDKR